MTLPDADMFTFKEGIVGGDECILIHPDNIKCKWTEDTLKFRSMIVRKSDNHIISRSFPKFFNYSEQPDIGKFPDGPFEVIAKMDGSLIIWGIHNNELVHRTRGTFTAETMDNGHEIKFLADKYPKLIAGIYINPEYSILTEWETKTNIIVINRVNSPTLTLVGVIHNQTGILMSQKELDEKAIAWGVERPPRYYYESMLELISDVDLWVGREGVVIYSECGQYLRKIKSCWYCSLHSMATGIKGVKQVLDVFMASPRFTKSEDFYKYIETTLDFEIAEKCKEFIKEICLNYRFYLTNIEVIQLIVNDIIRPLGSRKEQALEIQRRFKGIDMQHAFIYLDNREVEDKLLRKALEEISDT